MLAIQFFFSLSRAKALCGILEFFCGLKVLSYGCMMKRIHIFIFPKEAREPSEGDVLGKVNVLYREARLEKALCPNRIYAMD
jgi:hypothetical protein